MAKKSRSMPEVQVIKKVVNTITRQGGANPGWDKTLELVAKAEKLSSEVQEVLDVLSPKMKDLVQTLTDAYASAPEKDCSFAASPINPLRLRHNLKAHLIVRGLRLDDTFIPDVTKVPAFKDYVKESTKWLTKFCNKETVNV